MAKFNLLPCPFCGSDNVTIAKSKIIDGMFSVGCIKCNVTTAFYVNEKFAAEAWNTRASGWIPCSEIKPAADSYKWAVGITSSGRCIAFQEHNAYENDNGGISVPTYLSHGSEIIRWMPLPSAPEVTNNVD